MRGPQIHTSWLRDSKLSNQTTYIPGPEQLQDRPHPLTHRRHEWSPPAVWGRGSGGAGGAHYQCAWSLPL